MEDQLKKTRPFSEVMLDIILILMLVSMFLIAQQFSEKVYKFGIILLIASTFFQIAYSNMPVGTRFGEAMWRMIMTFGIIFAVFGLGILLAPIFVGIVRG